MSDKFLVWNPKAGYPTTHHNTCDQAVREAERLAAANPGMAFHVMAPIGTAFVERPATYRLNPNYSCMPF